MAGQRYSELPQENAEAAEGEGSSNKAAGAGEAPPVANESAAEGSSFDLEAQTLHAAPSHRLNTTMSAASRYFNFFDRVQITRPGTSATTNGSGIENDGVFNNLTAKPDLNPPQDSDKPPTYDEAASDATPPYWEATVVSNYSDESYVDGLPVGNSVNFLWNLVVCASFQFFGFLLTYILHTSHAAKQGSRFGLGITFLTFGYSMISRNKDAISTSVDDGEPANRLTPVDPDSVADAASLDAIAGTQDTFESHLAGIHHTETAQKSNTVAYLVLALGTFIICKSVWDWVMVKRKEKEQEEAASAAMSAGSAARQAGRESEHSEGAEHSQEEEEEGTELQDL